MSQKKVWKNLEQIKSETDTVKRRESLLSDVQYDPILSFLKIYLTSVSTTSCLNKVMKQAIPKHSVLSQ